MKWVDALAGFFNVLGYAVRQQLVDYFFQVRALNVSSDNVNHFFTNLSDLEQTLFLK